MIPIAQAGLALTVSQWAVVLIVVCAVIGILIVVARTAGVAPPPWVIQILWIVGVAVVAILAIVFLMRFIS